MTIFLLKIVPRRGKRQEIIDLLRTVEDYAQMKPGFLECSLFEACGEDKTILYLERWNDSVEMHQHIQSPLFLRVLTAMELALEAPQMNFHEVNETQGLELVESLRISTT